MGAPTRQLFGDPAWWQLPLLLALSVAFESLFIWNGLNLMDEGWPLYAAMQLQSGGILYQDVFWVFPPGALLPAWLGYALDPPGLVAARILYAGFDVLLCGAIYGLGRRLMKAPYAFLGAALLAVAAPLSHILQLLFGFRFLLFSVLALLCFSQRLRSGQVRWLVAAGCFSGVALLFRLTPAFAACAGIGIGILAAGRCWRGWLGDALHFAVGFAAVVAPVLLYFAAVVGLEAVWQEVVVRPLWMTELQALPIPPLYFPQSLDRWQLEHAFSMLEFRLYPLLFLGYLCALGWRWWSALRAGKSFDDVLLLSTVVWGATYFLRSFGRADIPHLETAIPPVCLLIAHLAQPRASKMPARAWATALRVVSVFCAWVLLNGADLYALPSVRGERPVIALGGEVLAIPDVLAMVDPTVRAIQRHSSPGDILLDLSASPLIHALSERSGVGHSDLVMPGTFFDEAEESAFLARIEAASPALVLMPRQAFDARPERGVWATAPRIFEWVREHYVLRSELPAFILLGRRPDNASPAAGVSGGAAAEP
jgi:hypothetical protein